MFLKKVSLVLLVLLLVLNSICGCAKLFGRSSIYDDWQVINIEGCGIIRIPNEWSYFNEDGVIYVLNESSVPVMIQSHNYVMKEEESNKYFSNYKHLERLSNEVFSNSAMYEISTFLYEDKVIELPVINLYVETNDLEYKNVILVVWNMDIEEKLIKDIAKSFIMEKFVDKNQK